MIQKFDPRDFLEFAKEIYKKETNHKEAMLRTALGRCYYSAFLICRERLNLSSSAKHKEVYNKVKGMDRTLGKELTYLFIYRVGADYYMEMPCKIDRWGIADTVKCDREDVEMSIRRAERVVNMAHKVL